MTTTTATQTESVHLSGSSPLDLARDITSNNVAQLFPQVQPVHTTGSTASATGASSTLADSSDSLFSGHDEEQIRLMQEQCIVLDWNDVPVGAASKKVCHLMSNINKGLVHRAFSVFLFNSENKLLLQQRADEKITFPAMWTNTCCSHPLMTPDEAGLDGYDAAILGVKRAAQRKLDHELGIPAADVPLDNFDYLTRIHYLAPSSGPWGEHEIDYILFIKSDPHLDINPNEVKDSRYVTASELRDMFADKSLTFTPWFKLICESYLFTWWADLDKPSLANHRNDSINHMH